MTEFLMKYGFLMLALLFSSGFIIWIILRDDTTKECQEFKLTIWSYLLIRPLLRSSKDGDRAVQRGLTEREWTGWLLYALIAMLTILFTTIRK